MSRSRAWMLSRIAWLFAAGVVVAAPGHSADRLTPPRTLAGIEHGLQRVEETPLLLSVPRTCAPVGMDFVPPLPQVGGPVPSAAPGYAPVQRMPVEAAPHSLSGAPHGFVTQPRSVAPAVKPTHRLPQVTSEVAAPVKVAAKPSGESLLLIDRIDTSSKTQPALLAPVKPAPQVERAIEQAPATRPAMLAVRERALGITQNAIQLADRGAYFSARSEFIQALRVVTQALDAQSGDTQHSQALAEGLRALSEADDFAPSGARLEADLDLSSIIASHRTPVLKEQDLSGVSPLMALQQYYTFAQQRLTAAGGEEPAASQALFGLGRLTQLMAERSADSRRLHAPKAMTLFQAALAVDRRNARAAHELGVLYAQFGQLEDARRLLVISVNLAPEKYAWHNLAIVHERLGELDLARKARYELQLASQAAGNRTVASSGVSVEWVDAARFKDTAGPASTPPAVRAAARPTKASNPWLK